MKNRINLKSPNVKRHIDIGRLLFIIFWIVILASLLSFNVSASTTNPDVWDKAEEIMSDVYNQILAISTLAAIVTASIALLFMNFSKSDKTVGESRAWLKRILVSWAVLNGLGFIMAYITPFFAGGKWT